MLWEPLEYTYLIERNSLNFENENVAKINLKNQKYMEILLEMF